MNIEELKEQFNEWLWSWPEVEFTEEQLKEIKEEIPDDE